MKRIGSLVLLLTVCLVFAACDRQMQGGSNFSDSPATTTQGDATATTIADTVDGLTAAEAQALALDYAGVTAADVTGLRVETDLDDGVRHYDVEFFVGTTEYDVEIHAQTGAVISYDIDGQPMAVPTAAATEITAERAQEIALLHAGLTADGVKGLRAEYEIDDGVPHYDVQFRVDRVEYDYQIDAVTGEILSFEKDG